PPAPEEPAADDDEPERPKRRPVRAAAMTLALLVLLGGAVFGGWSYTQRQYYVGATEDGQVAVFRGIQGEIAGMDLSTVHSTSPADLDDLTLAAQEQVKQGIPAKSAPDAARRLAELTSDSPTNPNLKPTCPPSPSAVAVTTSPTPTGGPATPRPTASGSPAASGRPTTPAASTTTPDALPSDTVSPTLDPAACRSPE
ncbi:BofC C-terminal domain-containing protein, partial [Micromonospora sp. URMC 106]|uniref:BofC C-terminal domain-containing protein n=1 Tax=Micromonospora sp. URMC 106 TaxID=3423408 RepID=UPI003F1A1C1D